MKRASELGLQVIELGDQVLLVDKNISVNQVWGYDPSRNMVGIFYGAPTESTYVEIVASKEKIADIPLLVIEDEAEKLFEELADEWAVYPSAKDDVWQGIRVGYNKRSETHKYTEEDLRKAMNFASDFENSKLSEEIISDRYGIHGADSMNTSEAHEAFIQSLNKKELWIEVQPVKQSRFITTAMHKYEPKIENGQLKAVWR